MRTRSKEEMFRLIQEFAANERRVRGVVLNGSRANPDIAPDPFQDFDVVFFVKEIATFRSNTDWLSVFGEILIMQMPDLMQENPPLVDEPFTYLMQFVDGNRVDLRLYPVERLSSYERDSLSVVLYDPDDLFADLPPSSDVD